MTRPVTFALAALVVLATGHAGADEQATGAKELFFDPRARTVADAAPSVSAPRVDAKGRRLASTPSSSRNLGLSYWIELLETAGARGVRVANDRAFKSGDRIRLHFHGNAEGRIVIVQIGTSGTSTILFPDPTKGLDANAVRADADHVLPSDDHWFKFDSNAGTERLVVLFAKSQDELERAFPVSAKMDAAATAALLRATEQSSGSKDLVIETETQTTAEIGTYAVNVAGNPIALLISLRHR